MDDAQHPETARDPGDAQAASGEHNDAATTGAAARPRKRQRITVLIALGLAIVCAGGAVWYGASWWIASGGESVKYAQARDNVLRVGESDIVNFSSLDYHKVDQGLDLWAKISTGPLHDEVVKGKKANADRIRKAKTVTTAKIQDAAVTELDLRAGKARVIAAVKIKVKPEGKPPGEKSNRFQAELTRDDSGQWKISGLGPVPVGPVAGQQ